VPKLHLAWHEFAGLPLANEIVEQENVIFIHLRNGFIIDGKSAPPPPKEPTTTQLTIADRK